MAIEGEPFHDVQALHHDGAERIAERVCLVAMVSYEVDGSLFIAEAGRRGGALRCLSDRSWRLVLRPRAREFPEQTRHPRE